MASMEEAYQELEKLIARRGERLVSVEEFMATVLGISSSLDPQAQKLLEERAALRANTIDI